MNEERERETLGELPGDLYESEQPPGSAPRFTPPAQKQNLTRRDKRVRSSASPAPKLPVDEKARNLLILFFEWCRRFSFRTFDNSDFNTITITAETSSGLAIAENVNRNYLLIQNPSADSIFVDFGKAAGILTSIEIVSGGNYEPLKAPRNNINIIGALGGQRVIITEGVK